MDIYTTEEEQIQQLKKWFKTYGKTFLITVVFMTALGFGWRYWQAYQLAEREEASLIYEAMLNHQFASDQENAKQDAEKLLQDYAKTPYAHIASLVLAGYASEQGQYQAAQQRLQWALRHSQLPALKQIARLRLAQNDFLAKHYQAALKALKTVEDPAYQPLIAEMKGNVYSALKQTEKAKLAYVQALAGMPASGLLRPILQLKLDSLSRLMTVPGTAANPTAA